MPDDIEKKCKRMARELKDRVTLKEIMEVPEIVYENPEIEDAMCNYTMECGLSPSKIVFKRKKPQSRELKIEKIIFRAYIKTGDGGDNPYDPTKEGLRRAWDLSNSDYLTNSYGSMVWINLAYCDYCDELWRMDEANKKVDENNEKKLMCPDCGIDLRKASAPKSMYFEEVIRDGLCIETVEDLEKTLEDIFDGDINIDR